MEPKEAGTLNARAHCLRKLQRLEEAIADYSAAIELSDPSVRAYNNRAYCLAAVGRYREAVSDYSFVLHLDPCNSHALHNRGISHDKSGNYEAAVADYTAVINLEPTNVNAYYSRGFALGAHSCHGFHSFWLNTCTGPSGPTCATPSVRSRNSQS